MAGVSTTRGSVFKCQALGRLRATPSANTHFTEQILCVGSGMDPSVSILKRVLVVQGLGDSEITGCHYSLTFCLSQGFYSCTNIMHDASCGGKGLFSLHFHIAVHHQRMSGLELKQVRKQELMQRPWRDVSYWLASPSLLHLLSYRTQD
jgi:hypothetical protein